MSLPSRRVEAEESDEDKISFSQLTLNNAHLNNPGELIALLEDYLHGDLALCLMKRKSHSPGRM